MQRMMENKCYSSSSLRGHSDNWRNWCHAGWGIYISSLCVLNTRVHHINIPDYNPYRLMFTLHIQAKIIWWLEDPLVSSRKSRRTWQLIELSKDQLMSQILCIDLSRSFQWDCNHSSDLNIPELGLSFFWSHV